jgi:Flp pilus assembly pilin Flp
MSARALDIEYVDIDPATAWPLRPWAEGGSISAAEDTAGSGAVPATAAAAAGAGSRKARDRGASAVEWVVITAIVVAIVTGVGVLNSNAVKSKATNACEQIQKTNTDSGGTSGGCSTGTAP